MLMGTRRALLRAIVQQVYYTTGAQVMAFERGRGRWTRVSELSIGQFIAVVGPDVQPVFEQIRRIDWLPAEPVYDIEVEGTHNFLANGIVAHNTYLGEPRAKEKGTETSGTATTVPMDAGSQTAPGPGEPGAKE